MGSGSSIPKLNIVVDVGTVIPGGSGDNVNYYSGLASAIENLPSGSELQVAAGIYTEAILFNPGYTITFIGHAGSIFRNVAIAGGPGLITFENITFESTSGFVFVGNNFIFRNCKFIGPGIEFRNGSIEIENCTFRFAASNLNNYIGFKVDTVESITIQSSSVGIEQSQVRSITVMQICTTKSARVVNLYIKLSSPDISRCHRDRVELISTLGSNHITLIGTQVDLDGGRGRFKIGSSQYPIYVNGLTLINAPDESKWKLRSSSNVCMVGLLSNLRRQDS